MPFTKMVQKHVSRQLGGAVQTNGGFMVLLLVAILVLLINSYLVLVTYNIVMPKLLQENFVPITFFDAIALTILGHSLIS